MLHSSISPELLEKDKKENLINKSTDDLFILAGKYIFLAEQEESTYNFETAYAIKDKSTSPLIEKKLECEMMAIDITENKPNDYGDKYQDIEKSIINNNLSSLRFRIYLLLVKLNKLTIEEKIYTHNIENKLSKLKNDLSSQANNPIYLKELIDNLTSLKKIINTRHINNQELIESNIKSIRILKKLYQIQTKTKNIKVMERTGRNWLESNIKILQSRICQHPLIISYRKNTSNQKKIEMISIIGDLILGYINFVPAMVAAAMILNYGINEICSE